MRGEIDFPRDRGLATPTAINIGGTNSVADEEDIPGTSHGPTISTEAARTDGCESSCSCADDASECSAPLPRRPLWWSDPMRYRPASKGRRLHLAEPIDDVFTVLSS